MLLRELFEAPSKRAVLAFGRLNPPTVGHAKLVDTITGTEGDHYLFLSHTQKPKTDPLDFQTKLKFANQFFPGIEVGHPSVKTPVQALEFLQSKGYTDVVFVAGSDRVEGFQKLFDTYNGQADKTGKVPFKFNSIRVVSAGERDPDADDVSGMSASKMRALAAQGELESFAQGVPDKRLAKTMFDAVRSAMGVKDNVVADSLEEDNLTELFDKPYPYTLDIGSDKATARISLPDGTNLRVGFLKGKTQWDMAFDRDGTFDADDQGDQFKVMATVVAAFKEFVEKVKPAKITFDADKDSTNSRVDVYAKMLNRYADKMGYGFTAKNPEGDSIIQYTLTKGKPNVKNTTQPQKDVPAAKTSADLPITPTDAPIKKLALSMWDESRIFNLHKAGKVDLGDAIAKLSPEDQVWAKLRWQQGLKLGQIGKKYNLDNTKSIQKYKLIHDKIRQNLGLKDTAAENTSLDEADRVFKKSMSGDTKSFRYTSGGGRLPTDGTAAAKDITKKAKQTDMPDGSYEIDFDNLDREKLKKVVAKLIPTLGHKKNEMVLRARFGLAPFEKEYTLDQIAKALGVTKEVIRQREAKALRQLRHIDRSRELRPFLDSLGEDTNLKEFDVRNSKKYSKAETYKGYEIYVSVDPVLQGQHMAVAYDRAGKEAFRGKGRVPEQAANMIKDTVDGRQKSSTKVEGNATIDFNAQFSREILEPGIDKIYAKIVAGPKLVVANTEYYDDADALAQMKFKPTAFRTKEGLLAMGMTAKQTQGADLIANGRYYVGDKSYDEFENTVYDLDFHSVVNDKNEKYSLGKPGLTVATRRT